MVVVRDLRCCLLGHLHFSTRGSAFHKSDSEMIENRCDNHWRWRDCITGRCVYCVLHRRLKFSCKWVAVKFSCTWVARSPELPANPKRDLDTTNSYQKFNKRTTKNAWHVLSFYHEPRFGCDMNSSSIVSWHSLGTRQLLTKVSNSSFVSNSVWKPTRELLSALFGEKGVEYQRKKSLIILFWASFICNETRQPDLRNTRNKSMLSRKCWATQSWVLVGSTLRIEANHSTHCATNAFKVPVIPKIRIAKEFTLRKFGEIRWENFKLGDLNSGIHRNYSLNWHISWICCKANKKQNKYKVRKQMWCMRELLLEKPVCFGPKYHLLSPTF